MSCCGLESGDATRRSHALPRQRRDDHERSPDIIVPSTYSHSSKHSPSMMHTRRRHRHATPGLRRLVAKRSLRLAQRTPGPASPSSLINVTPAARRGGSAPLSRRCRSRQASPSCLGRDSRATFVPVGFPLGPLKGPSLRCSARLRIRWMAARACSRLRMGRAGTNRATPFHGG
jgi:hypothetical protein